MKQRSWIVLRPVCFFLFLIVVVLSLAALLITIWFGKVARIEKDVKFVSNNFNQEFISVIQNAAAFFSPNNASAINLARLLSFSLDDNDLHYFTNIQSKVVPALFQACSTIPYLSQISYIGSNGLFFAYYKEGGDSYAALYSNMTFPSRNDHTENYTWYVQPADRDTGKLYGEAIMFPAPAVVEATWFRAALNSSNGYASVGTGWQNPQEFVLLSNVGLNGTGVISLGFAMRPLIDFLAAAMALYDGSLKLASKDWNVVVRGFPNSTTRNFLDDRDHVLFQTAGNISCQSYNGSVLSIGGRKYVILCSPAEIGGLEFVYVFAVARDEYASLVHKNIRLSFVLVVLMVGGVVVTICVFVSLIVEAARREMFLCGALINQMESTQQSERKSMNKSLAFASASHDIRASLAGITGLIDLCRGEVTKRDPSRSDVVANLLQMEGCTRDLLGILNCILDTSKMEAGKMQLEEEEFDVELLEDVVDLYHPAGMKKGVDVILDPCDGSVLIWSRARGDRSKLKQILSNLLSNAIKFTSEGHVTVRAWARKPSLKNEMLASTQNKSMSCLLCLLFKIHRANNEAESVQRDPNSLDFTFEVNDTGKGIPKEKRQSVFENYIQVKETAFGQQGTGLGLGIVQSLVRLMGGDIEIVEKEVGEGGTCFRFNVLLSVGASGANGEYGSSDFFQHPGLFTRRVNSPRAERSQVVLLVKSAKRSNVLQSFMQKLGIKVHVVRQHEQLAPTLRQMKRSKPSLSSHSPEGNSRSDGSVPLSSLDGTDYDVSLTQSQSQSHQKRPNAAAGLSGFVLLVIDRRSGPFRGISRAVAEFRKGLNHNCYSRVVWLDTPVPDHDHSSSRSFDEDVLPPSDLVMSKPLHGSRLHQTIALLPEFGGIPPRRGEIRNVTAHGKGDIEEGGRPEPLMGKKILVVDDDPVGRKIATFVASQLGATSFGCENGAAALQLVCTALGGEPSAFMDSARFDCILMDCQMPVMDGIEATARIREAESGYGVRTPIFALTAHDKGEEIDKMMRAGVDGYITKPLNKDCFLKIVSQFIG
ncbi:hypothetical protein C2S53_010809 [Perilla frutescens var. hirtella]|uniref:histidine kinase n=1 Tax=Perilla frutescens var. hirtella TaxID=608512 RepID=A0AAD4JP23_PERFH|nr:hypothetical protein C2S53_010809 [Perilla frutescens var. hirtella]